MLFQFRRLTEYASGLWGVGCRRGHVGASFDGGGGVCCWEVVSGVDMTFDRFVLQSLLDFSLLSFLMTLCGSLTAQIDRQTCRGRMGHAVAVTTQSLHQD
ncbi:hypothetical protein J6590_078767 [Homalodisca vitripennis]|nr:hypothetical protein J6590_078767 [Homalodisca vitripennis]